MDGGVCDNQVYICCMHGWALIISACLNLIGSVATNHLPQQLEILDSLEELEALGFTVFLCEAVCIKQRMERFWKELILIRCIVAAWTFSDPSRVDNGKITVGKCWGNFFKQCHSAPLFIFSSIDCNWSQSAVTSCSLEAEWPHIHSAVPSLTPEQSRHLQFHSDTKISDYTRLVTLWHLSDGPVATCLPAAY